MPPNSTFPKNVPAIKVVFLSLKKHPVFIIMTLAYFSGYSHKKYSAKMHVCRNNTIASFTPLIQKKRNQ